MIRKNPRLSRFNCIVQRGVWQNAGAQKAFSLVELSITLVILGLLVGGVLTGQSLIRAAQLRAIATELSRFQTAVNTFDVRYNQLPGDMDNAELFWGTDPDGCHDTSKRQEAHRETCNGNGDGKIAEWNRPGLSNGYTTAQYTERYTFWQHMANAGLIDGSYTANNLTTESDFRNLGQVIGVNVPASKAGDNTGWGLYTHHWSTNGNYEYFGVSDASQPSNAKAGLAWGRGVSAPSRRSFLDEPALIPEEAWNVDTKLDDGRPGTGKVMSTDFATCNVGASSSSDFDGEYALNRKEVLCALVFPEPF